VKKKAVMALHALYTMAPHALPKINTYVRQALRVDNLSVIGSAIDLLYILAKVTFFYRFSNDFAGGSINTKRSCTKSCQHLKTDY